MKDTENQVPYLVSLFLLGEKRNEDFEKIIAKIKIH